MRLSSNEDIQSTTDEITDFLKLNGHNLSTIAKYSSLIEEILLEYKECVGDVTFSVYFSQKIEKIDIILFVYGSKHNIFKDSYSLVINNLLSDFEDNLPEWSYHHGINRIKFSIPAFVSSLDSIRFSWQYVKKQRVRFYFAIFSQIINIVCSVVIPLLTAKIIQNLIVSSFSQVIWVGGILLGSKMLKDAFLCIANYNYNYVTLSVYRDIEHDLSGCVLSLATKCTEERGSGVFINRLTNDITNISRSFTDIADRTCTAMNYIGILVATCILSPLICLFQVILLIALAILDYVRVKIRVRNSRKVKTANERMTSLINETIRANRDIKLMNKGNQFVDKIDERVSLSNKLFLKLIKSDWIFRLSRLELTNIASFVYILFLIFFMSRGAISASIAIVLFNYNFNLSEAATFFGGLADYFSDLLASHERIYQLMHSEEYLKEQFGNIHRDNLSGDICFDNVSFAYVQETSRLQVFQNLSFNIKNKECVAFVGKSGCGKTTILNMISRLYDPQSGNIYINGINIRDYDTKTLRDNMLVVNQYPYIFNDTVRENLALTKTTMSDDDMIAACKAASIHNDIMQFPYEYDTQLGEGGVNISGGQRQRLAFARGLINIKQPSIIMLDEATSSLDNETQAKIKQTIFEMRKNATVILVAHRLSTVIDCDRLFFIENGKIAAEGTHKYLMEHCEGYAALYREEN